jgi:Tfp pilus assembly protein PilF
VSQASLTERVSAAAHQRPYRDVADELTKALSQLLAAQAQVDVSGAGSWSYLTESDLRIQLSKAPCADDRYAQEWAALLAAARAVSLNPACARPWLTLAEAAATRGLYRVAEAAAERAYEIEKDEATVVAGYLQAIINVGRYEDALGLLGSASDSWSQCVRGYIALRLGKADKAIQHFADVTIDPTWFRAWYSYICALIITGDLASARLKSEALMRATADRDGERVWLQAAAFDARIHGRLDEAREFAEKLLKAAGPEDVNALQAMGETLILDNDQTGWELLARALAEDPQPTSIGGWEQQERPVLAALAAARGLELDFARLDPAVRHVHARSDTSDPIAELQRTTAAATGPSVVVVARAARLTEAALRAANEAADRILEELLEKLAAEDELRAEAESLRRHTAEPTGQDSQTSQAPGNESPGGDVPLGDLPVMRLRLPASWFANYACPVHEHPLFVRYLPELRMRLKWIVPPVQVAVSDDLEPDGYEILADDRFLSSGHVDPKLRYCAHDTLSLLPERARTNPRTVATDKGWGIPSDVLDGDRGLAALLTMSAAEVVASRYGDAVRDHGDLGVRDMPATLNVNELAHRRWEIRGRLVGSHRPALADWLAAKRLRHQLIEEAAYFRWINRGRPIGDPRADWFASEAEIASGQPVHGHWADTFVDERLRHQLIEEAAYFRWINRGRPIGDPRADWSASETEVVNGG